MMSKLWLPSLLFGHLRAIAEFLCEHPYHGDLAMVFPCLRLAYLPAKFHGDLRINVLSRPSGSAIELTISAALLDRLLHHLLHQCHIVNIRGNSYRMRHHRELSKAIHPTAARAVSAEQSQIEEPS